MSAPVRRAVAAFAALACALLVVTGCTGTPAPVSAPASGPAPDRVVADAVAATLAAGSARLTADVGSPAGAVTASGPVRFSPFAADLSATVQGRPVEVRAVDGKSWVRLGERWRPVAPGLVPVGALPGAVQAASGLRDVVVEGPDTVDGAPATRYRGSVDLDAAAAADPGVAGSLRELSALVTPRPGVEVWVGPDGRLAQLRMAPAGAAPVTVGLTDPGLPVDVAPPPA